MEQITIDDLLRKNEPIIEEDGLPVPAYGEKVYTIPDDVWKTRCQICSHKNADKNTQIPFSAMWQYRYDKYLPCRILGLCKCHDRPGECMSFAPIYGLYGICETCEHNNIFCEGFCMKKDHAEQRRVYYGGDYGGDARKVDYYSRHRFCVCDDYEPDESVRRNKQWVSELSKDRSQKAE